MQATTVEAATPEISIELRAERHGSRGAIVARSSRSPHRCSSGRSLPGERDHRRPCCAALREPRQGVSGKSCCMPSPTTGRASPPGLVTRAATRVASSRSSSSVAARSRSRRRRRRPARGGRVRCRPPPPGERVCRTPCRGAGPHRHRARASASEPRAEMGPKRYTFGAEVIPAKSK